MGKAVALVADSTPHQEYKLVMQALPRKYFDLVRAEEVRLGRRTFGARFMGPEVTGPILRPSCEQGWGRTPIA